VSQPARSREPNPKYFHIRIAGVPILATLSALCLAAGSVLLITQIEGETPAPLASYLTTIGAAGVVAALLIRLHPRQPHSGHEGGETARSVTSAPARVPVPAMRGADATDRLFPPRDQAYWDSTADIFESLLEERNDDPPPR